jgi:hypothetical protein
MAELVWDKVGDRTYESGLDRGVLYLPDGSAVPWNGLTSIIEDFNIDSAPVYYDGMKISDLVTLGEFAATMKAITYPDEFLELEHLGELRHGLYVSDQKPQTFGLCYRTQVGNDVDGDAEGYKIHILYNVLAVPNNKAYETLSDKTNPSEFEWKITAVPEEVPGFRPTAHLVLDTRKVDPLLLAVIEHDLYGDTFSTAVLLPMQDLVEYITQWFRVQITDNGNGTWTATANVDGLIEFGLDGLFDILHVNAVYLNGYTFIISDTRDAYDVPLIKIFNIGDGTWSANADADGLIELVEDGLVQINNANITFLTEDTYEIFNTPA